MLKQLTVQWQTKCKMNSNIHKNTISTLIEQLINTKHKN